MTTNKVIDIKSKKPFKHNKLCDEHQADYVHDTAPDVLAAQHLITSTINLELERQLKERLEDKDA